MGGKRRLLWCIMSTFACLLIGLSSLMAQGVGEITGRVTDPSGAVVSGAHVRLLNESGMAVATTATDAQGRYSFGDLPAATYSLEVEFPGFRKSIVQALSLGGGRAQEQNVALQVGSSATTVTVAAQLATVETSESESTGSPGGRVGSGRTLGTGGGLGTGTEKKVEGGRAWGTGGGYPSPGAVSSTRSRMEAAARGSELGDLFQYKLKDRVTIHKNESALVPIVQTHVAAEKVSVWNSSMNSPRPMRALWLTNSSELTLDGGGFSVLEDEAFAGEGLTESIKPGEKRLVSYAADLGVRVESISTSDPQQVRHLRIAHGVMIQTSEMQQQTVYVVRDDDTTPRTVLIEHPLHPGWKISGESPKPEETTTGVYRFRVTVAPKDTATLTLREAQPVETRYQVSNIDDQQIALFLRQKTINPEVEAALRKIVEQKNRVAALEAEVARRGEEKQSIYDDQQRLRENLKSLKGSAEERALTQRYTQQLANQENRLQTLEQETADYQAKHDQAESALDKMIEDLALDVTL